MKTRIVEIILGGTLALTTALSSGTESRVEKFVQGIPYPLGEKPYVLKVDKYEDIESVIQLYIEIHYSDYSVKVDSHRSGLQRLRILDLVNREDKEDRVVLRFDITESPRREFTKEERKEIDKMAQAYAKIMEEERKKVTPEEKARRKALAEKRLAEFKEREARKLKEKQERESKVNQGQNKEDIQKSTEEE